MFDRLVCYVVAMFLLAGAWPSWRGGQRAFAATLLLGAFVLGYVGSMEVPAP